MLTTALHCISRSAAARVSDPGVNPPESLKCRTGALGQTFYVRRLCVRYTNFSQSLLNRGMLFIRTLSIRGVEVTFCSVRGAPSRAFHYARTSSSSPPCHSKSVVTCKNVLSVQKIYHLCYRVCQETSVRAAVSADGVSPRARLLDEISVREHSELILSTP